jgi:branched-chain amino acid transport system substrate-binding protein
MARILFSFLLSIFSVVVFGVASAQEKLVVGQSAEFSGEAIAKENMLGARAYFLWLNSQGGIQGRHVELISYDDQRDPKKTSENTEKLLRTCSVSFQ